MLFPVSVPGVNEKLLKDMETLMERYGEKRNHDMDESENKKLKRS